MRNRTLWASTTASGSWEANCATRWEAAALNMARRTSRYQRGQQDAGCGPTGQDDTGGTTLHLVLQRMTPPWSGAAAASSGLALF